MNPKQSRSVPIRQLPQEIRPRERLLYSGAHTLTDLELIALVLGNGTKGANALAVAEEVAAELGGLGELSNATAEQLSGIKGMGNAKACRLLAALELGKRLSAALPAKRLQLGSAAAVADYLMPRMRHLDREHFVAIVVNSKNQVLKVIDIAVGSLSQAIVHPRELFKAAIKANCAALIIAHNHPSGDPTPSAGDIALTKRLRQSGELLGIEIIDHIVIGDGTFTSFRRQGWFEIQTSGRFAAL